MSYYRHIRNECYEANRQLQTYKLVDLMLGNVGILDRDKGVFAIKPSGVEYEALTPAAMVVLDMEGKVVEGKLRPCADAPTYLRLFQEFKGVRAVVHTHSHYATIFAQAGLAIPCVGVIHADYFNGDIPVTRPMTVGEIHGANYERETGNVIVEQFVKVNPLEVPAVLVHGHGPFVWGTSGGQVLERAFALELLAKLAFKTLEINPETPPISAALREKHFRDKWGPEAAAGPVNTNR